MQVLITKSDFTDVVPLTSNFDFDKHIKPHAISAQELKLPDWLGVEFAQDVVSNPANYEVLLNGDGVFTGLKKILCYMAAADAVWTMNVTHTDSGTMFNNNEYATQASSAVLSNLSKTYYNKALSYWDWAEKYLDNNKDTYPLWRKDQCGCGRNDKTRARMTSVGAQPEHYNFDKYYYRRG